MQGIPGVPGTQGPIGLTGQPGADGRDGKDGADGQNGVDGLPGAAGKDGKDGVDGKDGKDASRNGVVKGLRVAPSSGAATLDLTITDTAKYIVPITAATTISFSALTLDTDESKTFEVWVEMGATAFEVTWSANITWVDDPPTLTASITHVFVFRTKNGTSFVGNYAHAI